MLEMTCGKGAYVRSVDRDLGKDLGCFGHVSQLRRTMVGPFNESLAISLDSLKELGHKGALDQALRPIETALVDIPALAVTGNEADRLKCGQAIRVTGCQLETTADREQVDPFAGQASTWQGLAAKQATLELRPPRELVVLEDRFDAVPE